ncbi:ABC transporter ATP-binding protein [Pseudonocardia asaccharolytica]|uniref:ABC transporter n=1 Tax=Pseudonocardia asaccharolytica DSM 44247 = NBRC 16224 TaxID=1123024 RepID=A0A511DBZ7_9PSEU|nr:ABC transporter ATP-binding protein [Pseudonocardia asaccharolytica]GEL20478.1 ABC transporter [Pseudonocardia asaccharolytica DSM 44247 = NBRC 16224]
MREIRVEHLGKTFGTLPVLSDVSLRAAPGEFVSIIGPSGCGKSTLFNVLAGLVAPDSGRVLVDGAPAGGSAFGYMPQKDLLFPWRTVLDNAALGLEVAGMRRRAARAKAQALFEPFGLAGFERARPSQLSGGMRQRAALLRTVVQDREVLLLDEPFGALDSLTRTGMQEWLEKVRARYGWTVLLITHDIREAVFLSDRVVVLGPRPARVCREVEVGLPRPREAGMVGWPRLHAVEAELLDALRGPGRTDPVPTTR